MDGKRSIEELVAIAPLDFGFDYLFPERATSPVRGPDEIDDRHDNDARNDDEHNNGEKECDQHSHRSKDGCEELAEPRFRLYRNVDDSHRTWSGRFCGLPIGKLFHGANIFLQALWRTRII